MTPGEHADIPPSAPEPTDRRLRRWRLVVVVSLVFTGLGVVCALASCALLMGNPSNTALGVAIGGVVGGILLAFFAGIGFTVGGVMLGKAKRKKALAEIGAVSVCGLRTGEVVGRSTLLECSSESVVLTRDRDWLCNGWLRLGLAFASIIAGFVILAMTGGFMAASIKAEIAMLGAWFVIPTGLATPFNVNWGASMTAADDAPGLVFERGFLFFFRTFDTIPAASIREIRIEETEYHCILRAICSDRRSRMLIMDEHRAEAVAKFHTLRDALLVAMGL